MSQAIYTPTISNIEEHEPDKKATFVIEPLLSGYGMTLGNSLRRVLLSSISGAAIVAFKAEGATHEFTTVPGVKEDLVQIMLNLKGVRLKILTNESNENENENEEEAEAEAEAEEEESEGNPDPQAPIRLELNKKGAGPVLAKDIKPHPDLEIANPEHLIATLDSASDKIDLELVVSFGLGYLPIEDSEVTYAQNDFISMDALFSPVLRVRYKLENTRVGRMTNLDKLNLTIETDGTITPKAAFEEAAAILKEHYTILSGATTIEAQSFQKINEEDLVEQNALEIDNRLALNLEDLHMSARTTNALVNNALYSVQDVINLSDAELRELKGFGTIALKELKEKLKELGF